MTTHLLSRKTHKPRNRVVLADDIGFDRARAHEACGPARRSFALWLAAAISGPILWVVPRWQAEQLNPDGIAPFTDPTRFLFVRPTRTEDLLWATEEILRSGAAGLVVSELPAPPPMTPIRRLHLAAEQGGTGSAAPLALLLTPDQGGCAGIESRWHMSPAHRPDTSAPVPQGLQRWHLQRLRARTLPPKSWQLQRAGGALPFGIVPPDRQTEILCQNV